MPTEFNDQIKQFAARVEQIHSSIQTEEATKMSMIIPFFQLLGYDVFNPSEFCPDENKNFTRYYIESLFWRQPLSVTI